jgi:hypothetical protein
MTNVRRTCLALSVAGALAFAAAGASLHVDLTFPSAPEAGGGPARCSN